MSAGLQFRGKDRYGVAHTGNHDGPVAEFVESKYERHWQSLDVRTEDHTQVGWIGRQDDGRLTWWADTSVDEEPQR